MSNLTVDDLTAFLEDRVGERLRSVAYYHEDGYELAYVRDDVAEEYTEAEIDDIFQGIRLEGFANSLEEEQYPHGDLSCVVRCFENAIEMHFPIDEGTGIAVAMEGETFVSNQTFIGTCLEKVSIDGSAAAETDD